jgi:dihydrofolate synthase/folylpolyglutamate synthase
MKLPHWPIPYGKKIIDLELTRIRKLLYNLGNPHLKMPPVIHVAGTNGKGTVSIKTARCLEYAGYKTGLFISPHISTFRERVTINSIKIS